MQQSSVGSLVTLWQLKRQMETVSLSQESTIHIWTPWLAMVGYLVMQLCYSNKRAFNT